jgi:hypothetical protein
MFILHEGSRRRKPERQIKRQYFCCVCNTAIVRAVKKSRKNVNRRLSIQQCFTSGGAPNTGVWGAVAWRCVKKFRNHFLNYNILENLLALLKLL